jgi:hypothetical protein
MIKLQSGGVKSESRGLTGIGEGPAVQGSIVDTLAANRGVRLA